MNESTWGMSFKGYRVWWKHDYITSMKVSDFYSVMKSQVGEVSDNFMSSEKKHKPRRKNRCKRWKGGKSRSKTKLVGLSAAHMAEKNTPLTLFMISNLFSQNGFDSGRCNKDPSGTKNIEASGYKTQLEGWQRFLVGTPWIQELLSVFVSRCFYAASLNPSRVFNGEQQDNQFSQSSSCKHMPSKTTIACCFFLFFFRKADMISTPKPKIPRNHTSHCRAVVPKVSP